MTERRYPIRPPTDKQRMFASSLVKQMLEVGALEAHRYARGVERCYDRREMGRFISEMKGIVEEELNRRRPCRGC